MNIINRSILSVLMLIASTQILKAQDTGSYEFMNGVKLNYKYKSKKVKRIDQLSQKKMKIELSSKNVFGRSYFEELNFYLALGTIDNDGSSFASSQIEIVSLGNNQYASVSLNVKCEDPEEYAYEVFSYKGGHGFEPRTVDSIDYETAKRFPCEEFLQLSLLKADEKVFSLNIEESAEPILLNSYFLY